MFILDENNLGKCYLQNNIMIMEIEVARQTEFIIKSCILLKDWYTYARKMDSLSCGL